MDGPPADPARPAWLEAETGERIDTPSPFTMGRSNSCTLPLDNTKASREHALLQYDRGGDKWWCSDLGSTNGTYVNGRKALQPVVIRNGDELRIGTQRWIFRQEKAGREETRNNDQELGPTIDQIEQIEAWLLLADVKGSTKLVNQLETRILAPRLKNWAVECEKIVDQHGGFVNEYMGDGLLAIWPTRETASRDVYRAIQQFRDAQVAADLRYRIFLHKGRIQIGGVVSSGRESVAGKEVNFIFKAEKILGKTVRYDLFISEPAASELGNFAELVTVGIYEIPGFEGGFPFYTLAD